MVEKKQYKLNISNSIGNLMTVHSTYRSDFNASLTPPSLFRFSQKQAMLCTGLSYVIARCVKCVPPTQAILFSLSAFTTHRIAFPFFVKIFEPYQDVSCAPLAGQILLHTTSILSGKMVCYLVGYPISFKQIQQLGLYFFTFLTVIYVALFKFRAMKAQHQQTDCIF